MMTDPRHDTIRLHADDPDARSAIASAVDTLLSAGEDDGRLTVVLDGERVPSDTIAGLIAGLRRLREHGGSLDITADSDAVRRALALTGLDRVFAPLPDEDAASDEAGPLTRWQDVVSRISAATFAALLAFLALPASAAADRPTDPAAILAKVEERNPNLSSYRGRMHVDLRMTSFPFIRQHLDGTTYYKKPSNYEVVFDRVPALAKGFDKMFTDVGDASNWQKRFVVTYQGEADYKGRKDLQLKLVQRVRGMIDHETVLIDPETWSIDSIRYDYYNGGHITMTQTFREAGGYSMLAEQDAEISIPYAKAVAHGTYSDYKTNVAVDDAVFTKKN
jgi:anti-anti-sigma regulatory factor